VTNGLDEKMIKGKNTRKKYIAKKVSRRNFLKRTTAIGSSLLGWSLIGSTKKASAKSYSGHPDHFGMLTDITRCIGCRRCEAACVESNSLPHPEIPFEDKSVFEQKRRPDSKLYTVVNRYYEPHWLGEPEYRKIQCNHCEEPACVSACLVGALKKSPEGPVIHKEKVCIGCRYCIISCPFYIPTYEYSNAFRPKVQKCFMCYHKIIKGEVPGCSGVCPVEAITFGKRSQLIKIARERIRNNPDRYVDHIYGEHEAGGTGWLYISRVPFKELGYQTDLGETPFPEFTKEFLSFVPLVLVVWPALLGGFYLFSKRREKVNKTENTHSNEKDDKK